MTTKSTAAASASTSSSSSVVKPWHFHTHLARLFQGRPASKPGAETWNCLDGWRGLLCLWMVAFHSFFYVGNFVKDESMYEIGLSPYLLVLNLGFLPVDGFFVLTGFLIAYPLFKEEYRRAKLIAEEEKNGTTVATKSDSSTSSSPWTFDLSTFYYRRVTRMLPSYILAVYFHCGLLFPGGIQHSMSVVRSNNFRNFLQRVLPDLKDAPNSCTPEKLFTNFTWMNHLMPFGGCMGWTWSFALQFNFYLFFPLLWKWAHTRLAKSVPSAKRTPSAFILPFLYFFLFANIVVRIITFFQIRQFDLRHEEGVFLGFFWYSNSITRGGAIVWGVLAAHATIHTNLIGYLRNNLWLVRLGWLLVSLLIFCQMFWSRLFADGNMVETPGWSAMEQTQKLGGKESLNDIFQSNVSAYWYHALFHILVLVGSPGSNFIFLFLLIVIVNGIGGLGQRLQSFLSLPIWYPISTLSWWVYLVHPAIMMRWYAYYVEFIGEIPASVPNLFINIGIQYCFSFTTALIAYVFIEQPLELILRQSEAAQQATNTQTNTVKSSSSTSSSSTSSSASAAPSTSRPATFFTRLRTIIFIYSVFCMVYIILHHIAMYLAVTTLQPKPYIERSDALPTRNNQYQTPTNQS